MIEKPNLNTHCAVCMEPLDDRPKVRCRFTPADGEPITGWAHKECAEAADRSSTALRTVDNLHKAAQ